MSEWKEVRLEDIVLSANTGLDAIRRAPIVENDTGIKCLRIQDISQSKKYENWGNSKVKDSDFEKARLRKGDLIMARTCSPGIVLNVKEDMNAVFNNGLARIRPKLDRVTSDYLFYLFKSRDFIGHIYGISTGTSVQLNMKLGDLLSYEFNLPELDEQNAITSILSSLDDKIDLLHRQNQTLEQMAETLFRQWFVEEADEGWEEINIESLFEVRDGTHDSPKKQDLGKKLITSRHLKTNYIDFENAYFISEEDYLSVNKRSKVEKGDILFSMIGTIGNLYLEESDNIDYAIKNIGLFKTSQNPKWRYFTYLWLKSELGSQFIHENRSGSTQEYISLGNLRSIVFYVESEFQVGEFNSVVNELFMKIKSNQTQIRTLTALRDTLLPKLMSGEVRVEF